VNEHVNLSKPIVLSGVTEKFDGHGRTLGWPTANIDCDPDIPDGVYLGTASLDKYTNHPASIFVGTPTTMGRVKRRVEVWLMDVENNDYYGKMLECSLLHFVRPNETFASEQQLREKLQDDEKYARWWFALK
jgi:FAD synthase